MSNEEAVVRGHMILPESGSNNEGFSQKTSSLEELEYVKNEEQQSNHLTRRTRGRFSNMIFQGLGSSSPVSGPPIPRESSAGSNK